MTPRARTPLLAGLAAALCAIAALALLAGRKEQRATVAGERMDASRDAPSASPATPHASVEPTGRAAAAVELDVPSDAAQVESTGEFAFDPAALYGTVASLDGAPIAGANVSVWPADPRRPALASGTSDAAGRFRFEELEPQPFYHLLCEAEGYVPERTSGRLGCGLSVVLEAGAPFAGVVRDAATREPLAGIELSIQGLASKRDAELAEDALALSGPDGAFSFPIALLDGKLHVLARTRTMAPSRHVFEVRADQRSGYEVWLPARREIALVIREADSGRPVADTLLDLDIPQSMQLQTDAAGRLSFMLADPPERTLHLAVGRQGWCTTHVEVDLDPSLTRSEVSVALSRGLRVSGRVVDPQGLPVAGAYLRFTGTSWQAKLPSVARASPGNLDVETDAEGRFDLTGLLPSEREMAVRAEHESLGRSDWQAIVLREYGDEASVELILQVGAVIEGRVTADGEPLRGSVQWQAGGEDGSVLANDAGEYRIPYVPQGEVGLRAHRLGGFVEGPNDGARKDSASLFVEAGRTYRQELDLGGGDSIRGRVLEHSGEVAANIPVWARGEDGEGHDAWLNGRTGPDGSFALPTFAPGFTFAVSAGNDHIHRVEQAGVVPGGPELELVLPPVGTLRLAVSDARSGASLPWCMLYWRHNGEPTFRTARDLGRPGPDGVCALELPAGLLDLRVSTLRVGYAASTVEGVLIDPAHPSAILRVALEQGVALEVAMRPLQPDPGRPPQGLVLATQSERAELEAEAAVSLVGFARRDLGYGRRLDTNGTTELRGLAPGTYGWFGLEEGYAVEPAEVVVPAVERHQVEVVWRRVEVPGKGESE